MSLAAALTLRARSDAALRALVPAERIVHGWYKGAEARPQLSFFTVYSEALEGGRGTESEEGSVQATIVADALSECHAIARRLRQLFATDWSADGLTYCAVPDGKREVPGSAVNELTLDFDVTAQ